MRWSSKVDFIWQLLDRRSIQTKKNKKKNKARQIIQICIVKQMIVSLNVKFLLSMCTITKNTNIHMLNTKCDLIKKARIQITASITIRDD